MKRPGWGRFQIGVVCLACATGCGSSSGGDESSDGRVDLAADADGGESADGPAGAVDSCVPATCASINATCGTLDDGCGATLHCGDCPPSQGCGWGGPNTCGDTPPEPEAVASQVDRTVSATIYQANRFLFEGPQPVQVDVPADTIEPLRVAVIRGKVTDAQGQPLSGVVITVLDRPDYGKTATRAAGAYDLVVNGGGLVVLQLRKDGYLAAQRMVQVRWQHLEVLDDVVLIEPDAKANPISAGQASVQVARGGVMTDADGVRQATLLFQPGTGATMTLAGGGTQPLSQMTVRATEYTVGERGLAAMPAVLPPTTAYTYALELSIDEAQAAAATDVTFDKPVIQYNENFLGFATGGAVPVGYYDEVKARWVASDNGRVVEIVGVTGNLAELDIDGSTQPATPEKLAELGVTDGEREQLAKLYAVGTSLWRVPITHFSTWDSNWGWGPPDGAGPPGQPPPSDDAPRGRSCTATGSEIGCQGQVLGEVQPIAGASIALHYHSDRVAGRKAAFTTRIPLTGNALPPGLTRVNLQIEIAGQRFEQSFQPAADQSFTFTWDGKDVYGRVLQGKQPATVKIGYAYPGAYQEPAELDRSFGYAGNGLLTATSLRGEVTLWQTHQLLLGTWDFRALELGGWSLSVHHVYDPMSQVLHRGDGRDRTDGVVTRVLETIAGTGETGFDGDGGPATKARIASPGGIAVDAEGNVYFADTWNSRVRRIGPDGRIVTVAGGGPQAGFAGDGGLATLAALSSPYDVAIDGRGNLYVADLGNHRIRRINADGIIETIAGNGTPGSMGDGGPATLASLNEPIGVAADGHGNIFIADRAEHRVRRVGSDGTITTIATEAELKLPHGVEVDGAGNVYIADTFNSCVRKVRPDGRMIPMMVCVPDRVKDAPRPVALAVAPDGAVYLADRDRVFRMRGEFGTPIPVVGVGSMGYSGDGGPARRAQLNGPSGLAFGPQGDLYVADTLNSRVRRVGKPLPGFVNSPLDIVSEDGAELYRFGAMGRHLRTVNALTGAPLYSFSYDSSGRLGGVTDGDGNTLTVRRDTSGAPTEIEAPFGQVTKLTVDAAGHLAHVTDPAGHATKLTYTSDGLLTTRTDARGLLHRFDYDVFGRLAKDSDPAGGYSQLSRVYQSTSHAVTRSTAEGRSTTYKTERLADDGVRQTNTFPSGLSADLLMSDGGSDLTMADGQKITSQLEPDPRFKMQAPVPAATTVTSPSGLKATTSVARAVELADPDDPLSLTSQTDTVTVNGRSYTSTFDAATRRTTTMTPAGRAAQHEIDAQGRVVYAEVPGLAPVVYAYDAHGRLETVTEGEGAEARTTTMTYDAKSNVASITDPLSRTVTFAYDPVGRVLSQTLPGNRQVSYTYDENGNMTALTPPSKPAHAFDYTPVDLDASYTAPQLGAEPSQTNYSYNKDRQLTAVTRPDGTSVALGYDTAGRLATVTAPRGTQTYTYDPTKGTLATVSSPDGVTLAYAYDGSLLTSSTWSGAVTGSVTRTYDNDFRVASRSVNGGNTVARSYDADGLLTAAGNLAISRNATTGFADGTTLGASLVTSMSYSGFGELSGSTTSHAGADQYSTTYTRDAGGRITQLDETVQGELRQINYHYDAAGRLERVTEDGIDVATYAYDENGNRLSFTDALGTVVSGTYDDQDRLTSCGDATYSYTANGPLLSKTTQTGTTSYSYDALGNLIAVTQPDGTAIEYVIDGQNRRVGKKVGGVLVKGWLYKDRLNPIAELDGAGAVVARFVYGTKPHVPDYMVKGGVTYRIVSDHLGSVRLVIDAATGAVAQRIDYDAFGQVELDTAPGFQPFGFAGGLYDEQTGLVRFGARDYDAEVGRWTRKDPKRFDADGHNLYVYALNEPVNFRDPSGKAIPLVVPVVTGAKEVLAICARNAACRNLLIVAGKAVLERLAEWIANHFSAQSDEGAADDACGRNPAQDKKLSRGEIKRLLDAGFDPHELKEDLGKSKSDLFKDREGNIYVKPKSGEGEGEPTGINIDDL